MTRGALILTLVEPDHRAVDRIVPTQRSWGALWRARLQEWRAPLEEVLREPFALEMAESNRRGLAWFMPILAVGHAIHFAVFRLSDAGRVGL